MLQKPHCLIFNQLSDHVAKDRSDCVKSLVGLTNICKAHVIEEDLLDYKNSHRLAQLRSSLHNAKTKRDNLGSKEEVDNIRGIVFD